MAVKNRTARSLKSNPAGRTVPSKAVPVEAPSKAAPATHPALPRTTIRYDVVINGTEVIGELLPRHSAEAFVAAWNSREIGERMPAKMVPVNLQVMPPITPAQRKNVSPRPESWPRIVTLFEVTSFGDSSKFETEQWLAESCVRSVNDIIEGRMEYHGLPKPEFLPATFNPVRFVELPEKREDAAPSEMVLYHVILPTGECIYTGTDRECAAFQGRHSNGEGRDLPELKVVAELFRAVRLEGGAH